MLFRDAFYFKRTGRNINMAKFACLVDRYVILRAPKNQPFACKACGYLAYGHLPFADYFV